LGIKTLYYQLTGVQRWREVVRHEIHYRVRYMDNHGRSILKSGLLEPAQTRWLTRVARKNHFDGFMDIGSCFGYYSVWLALKANIPECWAFEPNPDNYSRLSDHIARNSLQDRIKIYNLALSDQTGEIAFHLAEPTHPGASKVITDATAATHHDMHVIEVLAQPLDSIITLRGKQLLLKIDVEGYELAVLQGAKQLLTHNAAFIQIESFEKNRSDVDQLLRDLGFTYVKTIRDDHYYTNSNLIQG
jgi:FkbM family methyltransferase